MDKIRNFCIIAHIDHGKSTLADRMLEITGTIKASKNSQVLDKLELEQERGITIKLTPARMQWKGYELNLIDTPGHVDFQYEVSRSLAACQGVILLVDASQGVQAQTLSTLYMAIDYGLEIIPVLNKIDLPAANPERVGAEIEKLLGIPTSDIIKVSGKTGENVDQVLDTVISQIPAPTALTLPDTVNAGLSRCLIFDSVFDPYKGVVAYVQVVNGEFKAGQQVHAIHSDTTLTISEVGHFAPQYVADKTLSQGQIGYIVTGQKSVRDIQIGDTVISKISVDYKKISVDSEKKLIDDPVSYDIIGIAMKIHREMGGGMRESVYQNALISSLQDKGYSVQKEQRIDLVFEGKKVGTGIMDIVVNDDIFVELKSKGFLDQNDYKQTRTYLNSANYNTGLLIDFGGNSLNYKRLDKQSVQNNGGKSTAIQQNPLQSLTIPGFKKIKPYVYAGVYPMSNDEFDKLRDSFERLALNDSAIEYEYENNKALGFGFRCGFLGMLHMDIIKERLVREHKMETIFTIPNVVYLVKSKQKNIEEIKSGRNVLDLAKTGMWKYIANHEKWDNIDQLSQLAEHALADQLSQLCPMWLIVRSGGDMIPNGLVEDILEPMAEVEVVGPADYYGNISQLCQDYRGVLKSNEYINDRVLWKYRMPLGEIIVDFYDQLKSLTKGYATMNYEFVGYESSELDKLDILINGEVVEAFSMIVHSSKAYTTGNDITVRLKDLIPRHQFSIPLQAAIGSKIIARETIGAIKKDVLAKCYGGDVSRKRKLLEQQKEGKKKLKSIGRVNIPNDIFIKMVMR